MNKNIYVIIDPQNDFMDSPNFNGTLAVSGAYDDMLRLSQSIKNNVPDAIVVTLDTHSKNDIAHPEWWVDKDGNNPSPFTVISIEDVENKWLTKNSDMLEYSKEYLQKLKEQNKYELTIWPYHCILGTEGHKVEQHLMQTLLEWEVKTGNKVEYITKGTNPKTEHYSGLKAEVVLEGEEDTYLNVDLIKKINSYENVYFSGEASSHCVKGTVLDYLDNIKTSEYKKVNVLKDCMSCVYGHETQANDFFNSLNDKGVNVISSLPAKKPKI